MYENFIQKTILTISDCQYCTQKSCVRHYKFDCSCSYCRETRCYNCHKFNVELDALMTSCSEQARLYILNYVRDFFGASSFTSKFFFNFAKRFDIDAQNLHDIVWALNVHHGTKKGKHVEHQLHTANYSDYIYRIANRKFTCRR